MSESLVTVILATYNGAHFISDQLASLSKQSRRPDRLVLRDDGSTDGCVQIVQEWARAEQIELQIVEATERLGPARAFLAALQAAPSADVYLFCDQDDVWLPHKIERMVDLLACTDPTLPHLIATRLLIVDNRLTPLRLSSIPNHLSFNSAVCESVLTGCTMAFNNSLRTLLIRELPRQLAMHDWWCYLLASGAGRVSFDAEPSVMYRQHSQNSIGAEPQGVAGARNRLNRFFSSNTPKVRSQQLLEFARLHEKDLLPNAADFLAQFMIANRSIAGRWRAALTLRLKRQKAFDQLTTRISILTNRF